VSSNQCKVAEIEAGIATQTNRHKKRFNGRKWNFFWATFATTFKVLWPKLGMELGLWGPWVLEATKREWAILLLIKRRNNGKSLHPGTLLGHRCVLRHEIVFVSLLPCQLIDFLFCIFSSKSIDVPQGVCRIS